MAKQNLRLMISSRCKTKFPIGDTSGVELSTIRKQLKTEIEAEKFFGKPLVNVWINEEETDDGSVTSWEACVKQATECDAFIALFDGDAGWQKDGSGIGICHAEFETAHSSSPGKVRVISLVGDKPKLTPGPNVDFFSAINRANVLDARNFATADDLKKRAKEIVRELVLQLAHEGAREFKRSGPNTGEALDWSRLNFSERRDVMVGVLEASLAEKKKAKRDGNAVIVPVAKTAVLFRPTAMPAAFSVAAAREMVGQPFLQDHKIVGSLKEVGGPVHVVACRKSATEAQAMNLLGFPDATIVSGSFGIYIADNIQKIQICLISNCRDAASTKHGLQKLFEWLERTGEDKQLAIRALSRARILRAIERESR